MITRTFICFLVLGLLYNCTKTKNKNDHRTVFKYNQPNNITSLDPAFAKSQNNIWAVDHLYNRLIELNDNLEIVPAIASDWSISEDGKVYTFNLRKDVYFHDSPCFLEGKGRAVNAYDAVYSLGRIIDDEVNSPGSWIFGDKLVDGEPFVAVDSFTFQVNLKEAFRPMMGILTMHYCSILPEEAVDYFDIQFRSNPVGTGAFKMKIWLENQNLFLQKNENYFEQENGEALPYLDAIKISFMSDRKTAFLELKKGEIDLISGMDASYVNELLDVNGDLHPTLADDLQLIKSPYLNLEYIGINLATENTPLKNKYLRQALNYAVDRKLMMRTLRNNVGVPAEQGVTPLGLPSFNQDLSGYTYDLDKARSLLVKAGFDGTKEAPLITINTNSDYVDIATFLTSQWKQIGVNAKIEIIESASLRNAMTKGTIPMFRASWIGDYPDAENYFSLFYSGNPAPPRYTRFENKAFDSLYQSALKENNDSFRYSLYHQMEAILIEESPIIFLFYDQTALCAGAEWANLPSNAINLLSLKRVQKR